MKKVITDFHKLCATSLYPVTVYQQTTIQIILESLTSIFYIQISEHLGITFSGQSHNPSPITVVANTNPLGHDRR